MHHCYHCAVVSLTAQMCLAYMKDCIDCSFASGKRRLAVLAVCNKNDTSASVIRRHLMCADTQQSVCKFGRVGTT